MVPITAEDEDMLPKMKENASAMEKAMAPKALPLKEWT